MRDLLLSALVAGLLLATLKNPAIGAYVWAWLSIMNPHKLTYGFAHSMPWAAAAAALTLTLAVFSKARKPFPVNAITVVYVAMMLWMTLTSVFSINPPEDVQTRLIAAFKIHLMMWVTFMLLRGREQIEILIWVVVFSVGFYGIKGGLFTIATGGSGRVWGPPGGMLEGNNELAIGLIAVTPLMFYLQQTVVRRWLRWALLVCIVLIAFSVLGTQSRGALLALVAMALMWGLKSRYPVRASLGIMMLVGTAVMFMPDSWSSRMDTIQEYKADTSAMSRIYTWHTLWNVALDRPLLGAGFGADNFQVFQRYAPTDPQFDAVQGTVWVAHSIYFQALGEHGFVGLALFLSIGLLAWWRAGRLAKLADKDPAYADWVPLLMRMTQTGLLGYAVGGAFLSLMQLDLIYYVVGIVVLVDVTMKEEMRARARAPVPGTEVPSDSGAASSLARSKSADHGQR